MRVDRNTKSSGFTLIEMLLVLVVAASILVVASSYMQQKATAMRIDKTALQMQIILNAGLSYYVSNGRWPALLSDLVAGGYLQSGIANASPWGGTPYNITMTNPLQPSQGLFYVYVDILDPAVATVSGVPQTLITNANIIAGTMPMGATNRAAPLASGAGACTPSPATQPCKVIASVNIPGQNLSNITSVNFGGLYHHGACVPVPTCPTGTTAQLFVVPISVSGVNDLSDPNHVYPISSFSAYATAKSVAGGEPLACVTGYDASGNPIYGTLPLVCTNNPVGSPQPPSRQYWRACLHIVTERGSVGEDRRGSRWGADVTMAAFTRCAIDTEVHGSDYTPVYSTD